MDGSKKSDEQSTATPSRDGVANEPPASTSRERAFWREFFIGVVSHSLVYSLVYSVVPVVLAGASLAWLYFARDPSVLQWPFLIFLVLTIVLVYLSLISLQFFFPKDFTLHRRKSLHLALLAILVVTVTAPLALTLQAQKNAADKQIQLYIGVTDSMAKLLRKSNIDSRDLNDLLHHCIDSISLNKPQANDLRVTVVYAAKTKDKLLVMPEGGYYGAAFDRDIEGLYFDVSDRNPGDKDDEAYRQRVGVAGWSYREKQLVWDDDVQTDTPDKKYHYKPFPASQKYKPDRAMICVCIPDMEEGKENPDPCVGILSISSMTRGELTVSDLAVARFFATLLGRFKTPIEPSPAVLKAIAVNEKGPGK